MAKEEIINGNKLIARFMGWEDSPYPNLPNKMYRDEADEQIGIHIDHLAYHTSWDWLMPVVEKISTIHYGWDKIENPFDDCVYPRTFGMLDAEGKPMVRFNSSQVFTADTLIEVTYMAVVDFIKWYNNEKAIAKMKAKGYTGIL